MARASKVRCAACGHEGKPGVDDPKSVMSFVSVCGKCGSEDVFECGTDESEAAWDGAEARDGAAAKDGWGLR